MNNLKLTLYPRELLFSFFLLFLPISLILEMNTNIGLASYTDEVLCIICILYTIYFSFKRGIKSTDLLILILLIVLSAFTLIGNFSSKLVSTYMPIIVDFIALAKMITPFIVYRHIAMFDKNQKILNYLVFPSKLLILSGSFFGFISLFFNIGMTSGKRYGIPAFQFIFANHARFGYIVACCLLILMIAKVEPKKLIIYKILSLFCMILTTKGVVYIIVICYLLLQLMWRNKKELKFTLKNIVFLVIGTLAISGLQINTYLKDSTSPRVILLKYGFKTANTYFPFGSGFATYGSDSAARNYSPLYDLYGFDKYYGLTREYGAFLNDCYSGMVFGEFGYIGAIIFIAILVLIFIAVNKTDSLGKGVKAMIMAIFIGLIVSSIGTAIIKSSIGVFVFAVLGTACGYASNSRVITLNQNAETLEKGR